uniref:Uncharacterized protein n=1 Tax=Picea sitchensis TaxID=3332 RepID=A0A6B9XUE5_PICSI|nr:hypothetical protein Q903MT_gene3983 [Picea sitchensis]
MSHGDVFTIVKGVGKLSLLVVLLGFLLPCNEHTLYLLQWQSET